MSLRTFETFVGRDKPNRWLVLWYDGNDNHVSILDFGEDATWGPFGNEAETKEALWNYSVRNKEGPDYAPRADEIMLNGLIYVPGDPDFRVILDDQEITDFDIIEVRPS